MGISSHPVFSYPFLNGQHPGDFRSGVLRYLECLAACVACFRTIYTSDHEFLTILIFFFSVSLYPGVNECRGSFGSTLFNLMIHLI